MKYVSRYIFYQLAVGMVVVSCGLATVIWLTQSLRFVESIVNRGLSVSVFLNLTVLLLPNFLTIVLPIAMFTVVLFTYAKLNSDREIMVLKAAGFSAVHFAHDGHWTPLGHELAASAVAEWLRGQGIGD